MVRIYNKIPVLRLLLHPKMGGDMSPVSSEVPNALSAEYR